MSSCHFNSYAFIINVHVKIESNCNTLHQIFLNFILKDFHQGLGAGEDEDEDYEKEENL